MACAQPPKIKLSGHMYDKQTSDLMNSENTQSNIIRVDEADDNHNIDHKHATTKQTEREKFVIV